MNHLKMQRIQSPLRKVRSRAPKTRISSRKRKKSLRLKRHSSLQRARNYWTRIATSQGNLRLGMKVGWRH